MSVIVKGSGGGGKSSGLYVWKKSIPAYYEFPETAVEQLTLINSTSSTESCTVYYGDDFSYDETAKEYTLVSPSSITVQYSSYEDIEFLKNKYFTTSGSATTSNLYKGTDSTTGSTSTVSGRTYSVHVNNLVKLTASRVEEVFQNFATADDFAKYPDKAVHTDGYWYELFDSSVLIPENIREGIDIWGVVGTLVEGVAGIDFGEVTLASTAESVTVSHNLGVIPSWVALIPKTWGTKTNTTIQNLNGIALVYTYSYTKSSAENTITNETITFDKGGSTGFATDGFRAADYYWIAIA